MANDRPTLVINRRTGARYDVYIGRPSKWGNPFSHLPSQFATTVATRNEAIARYREWIQTQPQLLASLHELKGKVLGCWCDPMPCHGHVLADLADGLNE